MNFRPLFRLTIIYGLYVIIITYTSFGEIGAAFYISLTSRRISNEPIGA